jgi:predicted nucleotidyltransferase
MGKDVLEEVVSTIRGASPRVEKIILFGSRARADAHPRSDVDVAVACPQASEREWLDICEAVEDVPTLLSIDLIRLETAANSLRERILREGRSLYEYRSDQAIDRESR